MEIDIRASLPKPRRASLPWRHLGWILVVAAIASLAPRESAAQPFGAWVNSARNSNKYISVNHASALNPTAELTIEAWVSITSLNTGECVSIIGKGYVTAYWLGVCSNSGVGTFRTYLRGSGSLRDGGVVPIGPWTHVAVTFDGARRRHYINGELVLDQPEPGGPLPSNSAQVRIASDPDWNFPPQGSIDEVRIWRTARSTEQIRSTINVPLTSPQSGLVAVWGLNANANATVGSFNGANVNGILFFTFPVTISCGGGTPTSLCLDGRFQVTARHRTGAPGTAESQSRVVPFGNPNSGLFYFFDVNNWEIMVKALDACGLNDRHWIFSAATTSVFYRLEVADVRSGVNKIYFNYPGQPAPAVTDTNAFATCP